MNNTREFFYTYRVTNKLTGEYYIGKRKIDTPPERDAYYLGSGKKIRELKSHQSFDTFEKEIIDNVSSAQELADCERKLLTKEVLEDPKCLNIRRGGGGPAYQSQETKEKMKKKKTQEHRDRISKRMLERMREGKEE